MSYTPKGKTREKILAFVRERILAGRPPTVREVQAAFGFSAVETARRHLENLIAEGRLGRETGRARGYRLPAAQGFVHVPLLGRVQAGALTTAVEEPEGYLPVSSRPGQGELFALRVRGESMTGAGILPGDIAVVRRQSAADSGDIAVALVGDEATVKRVRLHEGRLELHAENPAFPPIVPRPGEVLILGKVIEIRRYLE
ncbi:MAG: transcriptional repressor LexA [Deltaproteobacteria bacterium]|nr:transcriptional repressor LexA [Deltaproteobacteria bacterium]